MKSFLFLAAIAFTGPAFADPAVTDPAPGSISAPAAAPAATPSTPDNPDKLICKSKMRTGSRFPEKTCMTKAQWNELWAKGRDATDNAQLRGFRANNGKTG